MIDLSAMLLAANTRLQTLIPEIASSGLAEEMDEAVVLKVRTPATFVMIPKESSAGRRVANTLDQIIDFEIVIGLVTESKQSRAAAATGDLGSLALRQEIKKAITGWKPPGALKSCVFLDAEWVGRAGSRSLTELRFRTQMNETFA